MASVARRSQRSTVAVSYAGLDAPDDEGQTKRKRKVNKQRTAVDASQTTLRPLIVPQSVERHGTESSQTDCVGSIVSLTMECLNSSSIGRKLTLKIFHFTFF